MSNVNNNNKAFISKNINIPSSDTDPLTKVNTCTSEGKSEHNLTVNKLQWYRDQKKTCISYQFSEKKTCLILFVYCSYIRFILS